MNKFEGEFINQPKPEVDTPEKPLVDGETYDVEGPLRTLEKISKNPKNLERFRQGALGRAKDIFESGELGKYIEPNESALYIGTGVGYVAKYIEEQVFQKNLQEGGQPQGRLIKLDLADLRMEENKDSKFVKGNARRLPFKEGSFKTIFLIDVLHHCKDQEEILEEIKKVLAPGGRIILLEDTVPEAENKKRRKLMEAVTGKMDDLFNQQPTGVNPHNYRSISEWQELLGQHDFQDVLEKHWYWGVTDFLPEKFRPKRPESATLARPFESTRLVASKH